MGLIALSAMESSEDQEVELMWFQGGCREREESEVYTYSYGIFFSRWMDPIDPSNIYAFLKSKKNLISLHRLEASAGRGD